MYEELRILHVLLTKHLIVRKRHWIGSIIELTLPICVIAIILAIRSGLDIKPNYVNGTSSFPIQNKTDLINYYAEKKDDINLLYQPQNKFTNDLMKNVTLCMQLNENQRHGFDTKNELLHSEMMNETKKIIIAIDFFHTNGAVTPKKLEYTIRSWKLIPSEKYFESKGRNTASDKFISKTPIVSLQMCLDDAFIDMSFNHTTTKLMVNIQKMPYPAYDFVSNAENNIHIAICSTGWLIFLPIICLMLTYVCGEKNSGAITLLKMNGVKPYQNFLSWPVFGMLFSMIPVSGVTGLLKWNLISKQTAVYANSNYILIWLPFYLNVVQLHAFCLHVASYFSNTLFAKAIVLTVTIAMEILATQDKQYVPYLGLFFPSAATARLFDELNHHENYFNGARWSNLFKAANPAFGITGSLGFIMLFTILGIIFHFILTLYLAAVLPNKYDVPKSPLFFLKHFWKTDNHDPAWTQTSQDQPQILEPVAHGALTPSIRMINMAKYYTIGLCTSQTVEAVKGVSMDYYKGQITALLGHNGAGKTTTFSILAGLTAPSRGTVYINGTDLSKNLDKIRNDLGVCQQENTVFPELTVLEQVRLVGLLKQKNRTKTQLIQDVDDLLMQLNISEKRNVMPDKLSGGQKRKLCLAMALIGNSSIIFLDEPTSGMDPETRRVTWDIILKYREHRTIIITTHSMEEADVLGDRIAIMDSGRVKCYGTPMFLKNHYGHGHHDVTISTGLKYNEAEIREIVGSDAKMNTTHRGRIVVTIPFTRSLPVILDNIENRKEELGITGVSVSTMTLEDVFLKVSEEESSGPVNDVDLTEVSPAVKEYEYVTGSNLTWQRMKALLWKRLIYFKTNTFHYFAIVLLVLLPSVLPLLIDIDSAGVMETKNDIMLDLRLYPSSEVLIESADPSLGKSFKNTIESLKGTGTLVKLGVGLNNELLSRAESNIAEYGTQQSRTRTIISAEFNSSSTVNGFYYGDAALSAPLLVNALSNLALKEAAGDQYSIVANIGDLLTLSSPVKESINHHYIIISIVLKLVLFIPMFFTAIALFVKHPLMENRNGVKQLQHMSGVSSFMYWGTMFIIDYAFYIIITVLSMVIIFATDFLGKSNTFSFTQFGPLLLLFLLFGINGILLVYLHSFMKKRYNIVGLILTLVPMLTLLVTLALYGLLSMGCENCDRTQIKIFYLQPHVSFVFGYWTFLAITSDHNARCQGLLDRLINSKYFEEDCANSLTYFGEYGIGEFVMYLLFVPILLIGLLCLLEQQMFTKLRLKFQNTTQTGNSSSTFEMRERQLLVADEVIDSDIGMERYIVRQAINERTGKQNRKDGSVFLAHGLSKCYGKVEAVKEVNFRVTTDECFGLLGVNGAGKSTTFRMLVGEEVPNTGILYCGPHSIKSHRTQYMERIGYCPQNDALIPYFNAEEHLSLFAALRGIPDSILASEVQLWINQLRLNKYAKNKSSTYSGGNKRRLNIAIALIASPEMILLDEPTTGVDPVARRSIWTIIQNCQKSGQAIILTSHSMEECEVLCNRLAIMVGGRLLCIGASQELKERFGAGFNITVKLNPERSQQDVMKIKDEMQTALACVLKDEHPGQLFYHVIDSNETWVKMYGTMNRIRSEYNCFEDFTVTTSTLEQLFIQFARSPADAEV